MADRDYSKYRDYGEYLEEAYERQAEAWAVLDGRGKRIDLQA